jgi:Ca2+-binding EF-hand superfamily protein
MHDLNGDGSLDASELERIYHQDQGSASANGASPEAAKQAVESFLSMADSDGDKKVSFKEFQASLDLPYEPENAEDDGEVPLSFQDGSH